MRRRAIVLTGSLSVLLLIAALSLSVSQFQGGTDFVVFRKATFDFILPAMKPGAKDIVQQLSLQATPGEIEPISFGVCSARDLPGAELSVSDLDGPNGARIPAAAIDTRVAQVWEQKGLRGRDFTTIKVPEALVKDDSLNWLDPKYSDTNLPSVPPDAKVKASLSANQPKQFFLIVHVPDNAAAGEYHGTVRVGDAFNPVQLPLTLRVLPFRLRDHGKIIGMYYNDSLTKAPLPAYRARLAFMRQMGVNALRILDSEETRAQELQEIKAAGFTGPIIPWNEDALWQPGGAQKIKQMVAALQAAGYPPYIYAVDEPNDADAPVGKRHSLQGEVVAYKRIHEAGGNAATALTWHTEQLLMAEHGQKLDLPLYAIGERFGMPDYVATVRANPNARDHELEGYYFGTWAENPRRNRLMMGFYLYHSRLDAAFGWTFYTYHVKEGQVFNDFDLDTNKKRWFTVFPTQEGCAPTLQSEAFREGVDDLRYLVTFLELAKEKEGQLGPAMVTQLRNQVLQSLEKFSDFGEAQPPETTATQFTNAEFDQARQQIIDAILKLQGQ